MPRSLLLDPDNWDITLDASGNLALAPESWSLAQDAASAIKLFAGEQYYDTSQGVPYWDEVLGKWPPISLIKGRMVEAALTVPKVVQAKCYLAAIGPDRLARGQVHVTDTDGNLSVATF